MPINMDYYFKMGDTGISLIELTEKEKAIDFLNDKNHLDNRITFLKILFHFLRNLFNL